MSVILQQAGAVGLVVPSGELRHETTQEVADAVDFFLARGVKAVVVSLRDVTALLSEGIRALVMVRDRVCAAEKAFRLTDLPHDVHYTLKIANLLEFLEHRETLETAVEDLGVSAEAFEPVQAEEAAAPEAGKPEEKRHAPRRFQTFGSRRPRSKNGEEGKAKASAAPADPMKELVAKHLPGRMAAEIVRHFRANHKSVLSVKDIADKIGAKEGAVRDKVRELARSGVLKNMGADTYNYAPDEELEARIRLFFEEWAQPDRQPQLMAMLLAAER